MSTAIEYATVIHGDDGSHEVSLPCCGETVHLPRVDRTLVCQSCHRELTDHEEIAGTDPVICVFCYTH